MQWLRLAVLVFDAKLMQTSHKGRVSCLTMSRKCLRNTQLSRKFARQMIAVCIMSKHVTSGFAFAMSKHMREQDIYIYI